MIDNEAKKQVKQDLKIQEKQNMEIRDTLAMERTRLANERTLLAYSRAAMALVLAGLSFMKFFKDPLYQTMGALFIPVGLAIGFMGYRRFIKEKKHIDKHCKTYTPTSPVHAEVAAQEKVETR